MHVNNPSNASNTNTNSNTSNDNKSTITFSSTSAYILCLCAFSNIVASIINSKDTELYRWMDIHLNTLFDIVINSLQMNYKHLYSLNLYYLFSSTFEKRM